MKIKLLPIEPPMAIICMCRDCSFCTRPVFAVFSAAILWSKWPRLTALASVLMIEALGSRLKLSMKRLVQGSFGPSSYSALAGESLPPGSLRLRFFSGSECSDITAIWEGTKKGREGEKWTRARVCHERMEGAGGAFLKLGQTAGLMGTLGPRDRGGPNWD
jgi:hypothetical protein